MEENGHVMSALEIENESEWISSLPNGEEKPLTAPVSAAVLLADVDATDSLLDDMDDVPVEAGNLLDEVDDCSAISSRHEVKKFVIPLEEERNVVEQLKVM